MTLGDLAPDEEWLLYEVAVEENHRLSGELTARFPFEEQMGEHGRNAVPHPCFISLVADAGQPVIVVDPQNGIAARVDGTETRAREGVVGDASFGWAQASVSSRVKMGATVPVLVGLDDVAYWKDQGAEFAFELDGQHTAGWKRVASGEIHCSMLPEELDQGDFVDTPAWTEGRDLASTFGLEREGFAWVTVSASYAYHLRLTDGSGTIVDDAWQADPASSDRSGARVVKAFDVTPPRLAFELPAIRGDDLGTGTGFSYFVMEMPGWAQPYLQRSLGTAGPG